MVQISDHEDELLEMKQKFEEIMELSENDSE